MSYVLALNEFIVASIVVTCAWLGILVYFSDKKSKINQIFFTMMFFLIAWVIFGFLNGMYLKDYDLTVFYVKMNLVAVSLFFILSYFFSVHFPREGKRHPILDGITIVVWSAIIMMFFSKEGVKGVEIGKFGDWGNEMLFGKDVQNFFFLATVLWMGLIFFNLLKKYFTLPANEKIKVQYFLIGISLFFLFNIIFNIVFPLIRGELKYYQFGDYSAIFIVIFTGLAIIKKELFGIKVVLVDLLVGFIGLILLALPFFMEGVIFKVIGWSIFILFCIFGYLLVKATHREAKQKEILEEKVKERTQEIEKRKEDLEKFYSLTVGRELKMVELKKKIQDMEDKTKADKNP